MLSPLLRTASAAVESFDHVEMRRLTAWNSKSASSGVSLRGFELVLFFPPRPDRLSGASHAGLGRHGFF